MKPVLEVRNLTHVYSAGTPFEHTALKNLNLNIYPGEFLGLIGHTGSGKSTLTQHLNGLLQPTEGNVMLDGTDLNSSAEFRHRARFRIGLVFQYPEYQLFEETVYKDIAFGPKNMGLSNSEIDIRVKEAAAFCGVGEELLEKSPFELSGGQKRRAAIAGVVSMRPDVLILDEPTAGLDPAGSFEILANLNRYRSETGSAIVMVSHSMEEIAINADRIAVLDHGTVFMTGTPAEVFAHAEELAAIGLDVPTVTKIFHRLHELGMNVDPSVYTIEQAIDQLCRDGGNTAC